MATKIICQSGYTRNISYYTEINQSGLYSGIKLAIAFQAIFIKIIKKTFFKISLSNSFGYPGVAL